MAVDLFAGVPVGDYEQALAWYQRLLGSAPSFLPSATEAVFQIGEHGWVFVVERPEHAGHAMHTIFVDDLDALVAGIAGRGIQPVERETYSSGVRKVTYRDADGNEIGFGGAPADTAGTAQGLMHDSHLKPPSRPIAFTALSLRPAGARAEPTICQQTPVAAARQRRDQLASCMICWKNRRLIRQPTGGRSVSSAMA